MKDLDHPNRTKSNPTVAVRVSGDYALWTRPENKVERVSYPIMTPSGARGVLEAIYWKPAFLWRIRDIVALHPPATYSLLRNEVNSKMSPSSEGLFADQDRTQRHSVCLRDVEYIVTAECIPLNGSEPAEKHRDIFRRRVEKGQCHHRPVLGTREFAAEFEPAEGSAEGCDWTEDLGLMLWDLDFSQSRKRAFPLFFHARIENGVMRVPPRPIGREA